MRKIIGLICLATLSGLAHAGATAPAKKAVSDWTGDAELGYISSRGNTETETINLKSKLQRLSTHWKHTAVFEAFNTAEQSSRIAERYFLSLQSDYKITERRYIFFLLSFEDDHFSGYDHRVTETIGYGRRVLQQESLSLDIEAGPGGRQSKLDNGVTEQEFTIRLATKFAWQVGATSSFNQELYSEKGQEATVNKSVTALTAKIADNLAMKITWTLKHNNNPPADVLKRDRATAVTLVFSFR